MIIQAVDCCFDGGEKVSFSQAWWCTDEILALGRLGACGKKPYNEVSYMVNLGTAWATYAKELAPSFRPPENELSRR